MQRREFFLAALAAPAAAAVRWDDEMKEGDTAIRLFPDGTGFGVGVRTSVAADHALVRVFYKTTVKSADLIPWSTAKEIKLLLSEESLAPVVGNEGYGATNKSFAIDPAKVEYITVAFLKKIGDPLTFKS